MNASEWNASVPIGARVAVTKADRSVIRTTTASEAMRVGQLDFIELEGYQGLWLLSWCRPLEMSEGFASPATSATDASEAAD